MMMTRPTASLFKADHFRPPGCEHALCSFHAQYLIAADGRPTALHPLPMTPQPAAPIQAEEGADRAIGFVARQWIAPVAPSASRPVPACTCGGAAGPAALSLDAFLEMARARTFSVSAMAFQDVWNLDLERVQGCCIHVMAPDQRLIPFCLYNLTAADGGPLYRL
ncbi:MAG: hypothetical protein WAU91_12340 [Desulfatitalea sp.]